MSDDNKTIVHHKVAAKVFIVMNQEDAAASTRSVSDFPSTFSCALQLASPSADGAA